MKRIIIFLISIFFVLGALVFTGCSKSGKPSDLYITAGDVAEVPEGEYTLVYSVNNYSEYEKKYDLQLFVYAYDEKNEEVAVKNNRTITVEADKTYTVEVVVYGRDKKDEQFEVYDHFTVQAVRSDRTVFFLNDSEENLFGPYMVKYGGNFFDNYTVPEVPEFTDAPDYYDINVTNKRWIVVLSDDSERELTEDDLKNVTSDVYVYADYEYTQSAKEHTITFVSNGGSETESYVGKSTEAPRMPERPERSGYVFMGWCEDEECTEYYQWTGNYSLDSDVTLYARWAKIIQDPTSDIKFVFTYNVDEFGNGCYSIRANDAENLDGDIVLPNCHDGYPVTTIEESGFRRSLITSVLIPSTYKLENPKAFYQAEKLITVMFEEGSEIDLIGLECFSGCKALKTINIPDSVKRISTQAFCNCLSLRNLNLPESLIFINEMAFYGCKSLVKAEIPDATEYIEDEAFAYCDELSVFTLGESSHIYQVGKDVLDGTSVTEIRIPARMRDKHAFEDCEGVTVKYYGVED